MIIQPLFDRVLLKKENQNTNFYIPEKESDRPIILEVVKLGGQIDDDGNSVEYVVNIGDKVLIHEYVSNEFEIDNQKYYIIKQCDIIAVIKEN